MNLNKLSLDVEEGSAAIESIALSLVGRVASWVGPLPIAIFTATETRAIFGVSNGVALAASVALELIGVNLANRYVKFTQYNATKTKSAPPVDEVLSRRLMWAFYALDFAVCGLIVGHRLALGQPVTNLIALLYPLAAAASIISMNQEIQLKRAQAAQAQEKEERKEAQAERKSAQTAKATPQIFAEVVDVLQNKNNGNGHHKNICVYCDAEFEKPQGLSAHLRHCAAYQSHKAHTAKVEAQQ